MQAFRRVEQSGFGIKGRTAAEAEVIVDTARAFTGAVRSAARFVQEGGGDTVKLESNRHTADSVAAIDSATD